MASTSAHKRRSILAAALLLVLALALAVGAPLARASGAGAAATKGGAAAPAGGGALFESGSSSPASKARSSAGPRAKPSLHVTSVRIMSATCTPAPKCNTNPHDVSAHGTLLISGVGLKANMVVGFPKSRGASVSSLSPAARLRSTSAGLVVTVPLRAHSGHVMVLLSHGRYTSSYGPIYVFSYALHPPAPKIPPASLVPPAANAAADAAAVTGQGMWIWYVSKSDGGEVASIVAQAHAAGVSTLYIKSSDGPSNYWSQFSPQLVAELHAAGLHVCAWQYVYGSEPLGEAALGAEAVAAGADCLVIDAESQYERQYAAAQTYIDALRAKIGASYPLALASFPYINYHPTFPYSVFLGPGGAQFNLPQMYWKDIGNSVDTTYANTFIVNRIYQRPIYPLGQTYGGVSSAEIVRFREEAVDYGSGGVSFWDWQETKPSGWSALAAPLEPLTSVTPNQEYPELSSGKKGDPVLWMQEHLAAAVPGQETTGIFSAQTVSDVETFQATHGIAASGVVEAATWQALLALTPVPVVWTGGGPAN